MPGLGQALEPRQDLGRVPRPPEQSVPELGVGGVDRDVERRQALRDDPLERGLVEIAERDVVAVQERQPEIVVLHVQTLAHALRKLVDEAEHALVGAGRDVPRARRLQLEPESRTAASKARRRREPGPLDRQLQPLVAGVELEVDRVAEPAGR